MDKNNSDYIFKAFIVNSAEYDNGNKETSGEWLHFPTTKENVSELFEKIGLPNNADSGKYFIDDYDSVYNDIAKSLPMYANIDELNYLASLISELEDMEIMVFRSVIQTDKITSVTDAINAAYNTECYTVVHNTDSWKQVGEYIAERQGFDVSRIGDLADYIDYEAYGHDYAEQNGGYLSGEKYVEKNSAYFTVRYNGEIENIPPEHIVTEYGANLHHDYNFDIEFEASKDLAAEIDNYMRNTDNAYATKYPDDFERLKYFSDCLIDKSTLSIKDMLTATNTHEGGALGEKICGFEQKYPCDKYMIYQLKGGDETRDYRFNSYSQLEKQGLTVNKANYEQTYVHYLSEDTTLEKLYTWFNTDIPQDFKGHSMSVSDIVVLLRNGEEKAYYCDSAGFVEVPEFFEEQAQQITPDALMTGEQIRTPRGSFYVTNMTVEQMKAAGYGLHHMSDDGKYLIMGNGTQAFAVAAEQPENNLQTAEQTPDEPQTITVLVVEPMQEPYVKEIPNTLEALQTEVGGLVAHMYPSDKPIALICNDEGKINGMQLNRALYDTEGEMYDIVAGPFVIAQIADEGFTSLSADLQQQFTNRFKNPEIFVKMAGEIKAIPVKPSIKTVLDKLKKEQGSKNEPQKKPSNQEL